MVAETGAAFVEGEYYPCKPGIFTVTYEPAEPDAENEPV